MLKLILRNFLEQVQGFSSFFFKTGSCHVLSCNTCAFANKIERDTHPDMHISQTCFKSLSPPDFWSLPGKYPDPLTGLHMQARPHG